MNKVIIEGGNKLSGKVDISGFKNAALPIIVGTILADDKCKIDNLPMIGDVYNLVKIMEMLGSKVHLDESGYMDIDTSTISDSILIDEITRKMRASYYLLGACLSRFGEVKVLYPGGCNIGVRPIDQHIKGFEALGAKVEVEHGVISCKADKLIGNKIYLDVVSVGATINIMMAATMAEGTTIIENAAKEPHIVDMANFINAMGGDIRGAGTDIIKINGVNKLHGCNYSVIPDQIEAGTYMIAAAATKGDVIINNVIPKHLEPVSAKLIEMGVEVAEYGDSIRVNGNSNMKSVNVKTLPYPGFPTDLQQPMTALLSGVKGTSIVTETVFEGRYKYVDELKRMGVDITVDGRTAIIKGVDTLMGAKVKATDLRGGAALIIAGLMANGVTEIEEAYHIERGYENFISKLLNLGAKVKEG
ncbi:UDP-N-acetylglucosamine 1-carboxyvinyltransferase [Anaerosalibacter bizertensis]|uniref:UDP-N-acetylglucosamine 1-carboxyvinyltransferase n=1 Tax=Anaerosalibacter bizertensis TaxID=932217 RepID=A0A9Q4AE58_9FIRM|nr:UDP-N-acetylglucosamine 1-carboxyvinyltransferase [Anaerosalibacter bizertensis]MBV1819536.1 UDP-N-acetylglucosamine 1-carboxyvinyltransferase [Bacteroidales bacterium MSK.15.36]MBU5294427.1 UDP-N-acetylglucosamine 1-carboxyvinyltransferase [Anaerosalibacter bizertensis]MCB5560113.1 UDP-N-acetylglucosamine 1-carboxyvinyltransferase [Anaerosalibacter bizertensis]MCG4565769.1 UDP-N-acetylglucosamine 1-carboxyvinyltransferase [Anaerosalibacter bizertensis]MCG4582964.1 UDP-N-acetylglucosamine 1